MIAAWVWFVLVAVVPEAAGLGEMWVAVQEKARKASWVKKRQWPC